MNMWTCDVNNSACSTGGIQLKMVKVFALICSELCLSLITYFMHPSAELELVAGMTSILSPSVF